MWGVRWGARTLRRIGKDAGGQTAIDQKFILNVLSYGVVPVLGLLAVQFPTAGTFLVTWFKPLLSLFRDEVFGESKPLMGKR